MQSADPVTTALARAERGEPGAAEELWALVYSDLKSLAAARLGRLGPGQTLQATALVHEVWVRLEGKGPVGWQGRAHFFGAAARSMRNILVDRARRRRQPRASAALDDRGELAELVADETAPAVDILALDEALTTLAREYERPARIVNLRFFAGLSIAQIAELLEVTSRTVDRDYLFARTWLRRHLDTG